MKTILEPLQGGLVVSCQAPADSPLHRAEVIAAMAAAALNQGAVGLRIDSPDHIRAVRAMAGQSPTSQHDRPIIGLWKQVIPPSAVYITPQFHHADAVAQAGSDIIAIDGTQRSRPDGETLGPLIQKIHDRLGKPVMADVDTLDNALLAVEAGADCVGTTLFGYTAATQGQTPPGFDLLQAMVEHCPVPVICEGGIASPSQARQALDLGAYAVVVGTAITGIDSLVSRYVNITR
ncbi:N-acetylmannosamine-6-phosphate 2-epimerase [Nodosilinea sp. LEGE 07088]|uniref:N-acetylmannosamine-6-phosphate 2-epimerase n=1 Tax=Nodosilinea sp. LEGE 07088 TaxID=2777968 RepID=UPI00187E0D13|nr:N-acetylmannosamine-6-phosphate 2-epimerase [Nodosilinea sp. LEGE 07088]MBE9135754.1 N-acetylmannosamine-6-phosphate 2-epimerase [Nodosilinea sp. LEGE 07088]